MKYLGHVPGKCVRHLNTIKKPDHVIKAHGSPENYAQKYQLSSVHAPINWPKDSRKDDYCINEEGMIELSTATVKRACRIHGNQNNWA